uniref:Uncharacterized protein n=1 Tax=Onchocerca volvulus TaxID=6282 RepID=A0A8R1XKM9_ONCVO
MLVQNYDAPEISIPQWVSKENRDLHVFLDASIRGIGVAVRRESNLLSKTLFDLWEIKIGSEEKGNNKSATIPRLELLVVALGTRIIEFLGQENAVENVYLWTDRSRYITKRITEIKGVKGIMFHHVKLADNPADLASRGVLPKVLKDSS